MGEFTASRPLVILGWIGAAVMGAAAAGMLLPSSLSARASPQIVGGAGISE